MVQATDTRVIHKEIDSVRVGKIKVPREGAQKVESSSLETVRYAALPGQFKVMARGSSLLLAQVRKGGNNGNGRCIPGIAKTPVNKRARRLTSSVKLNTSNLYYSLRLRSDGVDAIIQQGGQLYRVPLDVKAKWDAKRQKVVIDGKTLKSSKLVNTVLGPRLQFDHKELSKLVKPQVDAFIYEINNRTRSSGLAGAERGFEKIDGALAILKKRLKRSFKKHSGVRAMRTFLLKHHGLLKAHLISLIKERRRLARLRRQKGFTRSFRKKLKLLEHQNAKLRGRITTLKSKLWKIIYKYWIRDKRTRKRPC